MASVIVILIVGTGIGCSRTSSETATLERQRLEAELQHVKAEVEIAKASAEKAAAEAKTAQHLAERAAVPRDAETALAHLRQQFEKSDRVNGTQAWMTPEWWSVGAQIAQALCAIAIAVFGWFLQRSYRKQQERKQMLENEELQYRREIIAELTIEYQVYKFTENKVALHVTVLVTSKSRRAFCLPGVYVSFNSLLGDKAEDADIGRLLRVKNYAFFDNTVIQVGPDETESFDETYVLDANFVKNHPIVVAEVRVDGASRDLIGTYEVNGKLTVGCLRERWMEYANSKDKESQIYPVFHRRGFESKGDPDGGRVFLRKLNDEWDTQNSSELREMLDTVVAWTWKRSIVLDTNSKWSSDQSGPLHSLGAACLGGRSIDQAACEPLRGD